MERVAWRAAAERIFAPLCRELKRGGFSERDITEMVKDIVARPLIVRDDQTSYDLATRLISRWMLDTRFCDEAGAFELQIDGENSFATLAEMVDADPHETLLLLKKVGAVALRNGRVRLLAKGYVPTDGVLEKLEILGRDGAEFVKAMIHNVHSPKGKAFLQRRASYDNIGASALETLQSEVQTIGRDAVDTVNKKLAFVDRDRNPTAPEGERNRVSFGVYYFQESVGPARRRRATTRKRKAP